MLTQKLASGAHHVTGIDLSPDMIALVRELVPAANVDFIEGDFLNTPLHGQSFDFIVAVAVIHHVPFAAALTRMADLLCDGGVLAVLGLARDQSPADYAVSAVSVAVARIARLRRGWWQSPAARIDPVMTYSEIKTAAIGILPGVEVRRRLYFRYTLLWRKP